MTKQITKYVRHLPMLIPVVPGSFSSELLAREAKLAKMAIDAQEALIRHGYDRVRSMEYQPDQEVMQAVVEQMIRIHNERMQEAFRQGLSRALIVCELHNGITQDAGDTLE